MSISSSPKVAILVCTYNRYDSLMNTLKSVENQTYTNWECIVINDKSDDERYYQHQSSGKFIWVHLEKSSREAWGYPALAYVRNSGFNFVSDDVEYLAMLDDDDYYIPEKLEKQLRFMKDHNALISSTEGWVGKGYFDPKKKYIRYFKDLFCSNNKRFFKRLGRSWTGDLPMIIDQDIVRQRTSAIHSSMMVKKEVFEKVGGYGKIRNHGEYIDGEIKFQDKDLYERILEFTDLYYLSEPLVYYMQDLEGRKLLKYWWLVFLRGQKVRNL